MSVTDRLRALVSSAPPDATVPVRWIAEVLEQEAAGAGGDVTADLTLEDVHGLLGRAASTVRSWCQEGRIPGAYRMRGREWRIPRKGLQAFLAAEQLGGAGRASPRKAQASGPVDLGSWRRVKRHA